MGGALVVYESMFGNTRAVAEAVATGMARVAPGDAVDVIEVGTAPALAAVDADLLVIGAPTHAFGLSRPTTRSDAAARTGTGVLSTTIGVREWLEHAGAPAALPADGATPARRGLPAAVFDTRVLRRNLPGHAADAIARRLRQLGLSLVTEPATFTVDGYTGPLLPGELDRARAWGEYLATLLRALPLLPEDAGATGARGRTETPGTGRSAPRTGRPASGTGPSAPGSPR
ncbi:flavodoxin/nitric oxide synthase [Georgenia sp. TF02-10]|uniref:flavodoxin family protein n=1 Tax=Georgenia sp. TF02-10 TaxID=2917725 RepID=UPI001FA808E9|nr:flavodoxin/nitric oxide synthase [Georgenia sp. TF02-10]UNX55446.1 flavodoxin/nitric oxide synthase [Georgenia sp. TF02-10]